ncbi:DUF1643 domain-containing protein [Exiguobacterium sp. TBG-PICH-001]|uniref:DUF1643 domain-containing protein n=1 Tax=Exiguobacterium abrahamii TaxID=2785532 RepID=UPI0018A7D418|nr:DUF1643 domain-containing protein [Exiguobacterium sp. TBG-PICH-001]MBF8153862.1 DUF1643 domain-containing protein [Exiguobacterium sp. TBG-PICH-001]
MTLKDYPDYVKVPVKVDDTSTPIRCRFSLVAEINDRSNSNSVLVVMMNPSKATDKKTDSTVFNIIEHSYNFLNAKKVEILNLYPFYEPNSSKVKTSTSKLKDSEYDKLMSQNICTIKNSFKCNYDYIILAWGNAPKSFTSKEHKILGQSVLSSINDTSKHKIYVYSFNKYKGLTVKNNPFHPSRKGKIIGIQKVTSFSILKNHPKYSIMLDSKYLKNKNIGDILK